MNSHWIENLLQTIVVLRDYFLFKNLFVLSLVTFMFSGQHFRTSFKLYNRSTLCKLSFGCCPWLKIVRMTIIIKSIPF